MAPNIRPLGQQFLQGHILRRSSAKFLPQLVNPGRQVAISVNLRPQREVVFPVPIEIGQLVTAKTLLIFEALGLKQRVRGQLGQAGGQRGRVEAGHVSPLPETGFNPVV